MVRFLLIAVLLTSGSGLAEDKGKPEAKPATGKVASPPAGPTPTKMAKPVAGKAPEGGSWNGPVEKTQASEATPRMKVQGAPGNTAPPKSSCMVTQWQYINTGCDVEFALYMGDCTFVSEANCQGTKCDVTYNCCGPSAVIRVNQADWNRLKSEGKLDGLRYQQASWDESYYYYSVAFKKMKGTSPESISGEAFLP